MRRAATTPRSITCGAFGGGYLNAATLPSLTAAGMGVMVERVEGLSTPVEWQRAYQEIKDFEAQLVGFGTIVIKFWLHISGGAAAPLPGSPGGAEQGMEVDRRGLAQPEMGPVRRAVEEMLIRTTTAQAPWTIIPANDKYFARGRCSRWRSALPANCTWTSRPTHWCHCRWGQRHAHPGMGKGGGTAVRD